MKVTVLLTSYNHEAFIAESLRSVFTQDFSDNFEIIISDDASTDNTLRVIEEVAKEKPARVSFVIPPVIANQGLIRNIARGISYASGQLIVLQSGDDISEPSRLSGLVSLFLSTPGLKAAYSNATLINTFNQILKSHYHPPGFVWKGSPESLARSSSAFLGATSCYHRDVWEHFGPADPAIIQEDIIFPFRASLLGPTAYLPQALVRYRLHSSNIYFTDTSTLTPESFRASRLRIVHNQILAHSQRLADLLSLKPPHPHSRAIEAAIRHQIAEAEFEASLEFKSCAAIAWTLIRQVLSRPIRHTARLAAHHLLTGCHLRRGRNNHF